MFLWATCWQSPVKFLTLSVKKKNKRWRWRSFRWFNLFFIYFFLQHCSLPLLWNFQGCPVIVRLCRSLSAFISQLVTIYIAIRMCLIFFFRHFFQPENLMEWHTCSFGIEFPWKTFGNGPTRSESRCFLDQEFTNYNLQFKYQYFIILVVKN